MLSAISGNVVTPFRRFAEAIGPNPAPLDFKVRTAAGETVIPSLRVGPRRVLLLQAASGSGLDGVVRGLRESIDWGQVSEGDLQEILIGVAGTAFAGAAQQVVRLGVRAVPLHGAIAEIAGLPAGWLHSQQQVIDRILEPLRVGTEFRIARLRVPAENGEPDEDALEWLDRSLGRTGGAGRLIYLRAEAGKGKSTTFAELSRRYLDQNEGPIPLLIPLRSLPRGAGTSWEAIAGSVGAVGGATATLGHAVRAGLVMLLLDGLDEVSGRYDPGVIQEIVQAVSKEALGAATLLAFSGRTTEGMLLDRKVAYQRTIELPELGGPEFLRYAEQVVQAIVPEWPALAPQLGEPISSSEALPVRGFAHADQEHILQWVLVNFTEFGKDRSLFFVQSLACLARDMQLRGNQPIFVKQPGAAPKVLPTGLYDACICAASLACVREQGKVVPEARPLFTPARQLEIATWLAVLASVDDATRSSFPTPNRLIADTFALDPVNQNEELTAIVRQMQKHALLYASRGLVGGDWRPGFLSDWVRAALLVRAWIHRGQMGTGNSEALARAIATSQRARNAFQYIFPDRIRRANDVSLADLVAVLVPAASAGSPEACGNFWFLMEGLPNDAWAAIAARPQQVAEWTDFSEFSFEGLDFGPEFSANLAMFVRTQFISCRFNGCRFTQCDFTQASFVNCTFDNVRFEYCDGPVHFEECERISNTRFAEARSRELPAWVLSRCHFAGESRVEQTGLPRSDLYGPILALSECTCEGEPDKVLVGPELGQDWRRFTGLRLRTAGRAADPAVDCLRQLLRPFFPSRVGAPGTHQARDYIRSSAIGRGILPDGSPSVSELTSLLTAEGFTKGGRQGHLYAPWSDVAGATRVGLRSEFSAFLRNHNSRGSTIQQLLDKLRKAADWPET